MRKKIAVIGTGYVGLVTGVSLSVLGHEVLCVGRNLEKIDAINHGIPPFFEAGLEKVLRKVVKEKKLYATDQIYDSVIKSDIIIIAVGTPTYKNKIDLSIIKKASEQIGRALKDSKRYQVIVVKSTVVPTTTERIINPILKQYSGKDNNQFGLCMNPEFLREGEALSDALAPDRIVIGQYDERSGKEYAALYSKIKCPKIFTNIRTAELIKYSANALLATMISYSNEIAKIAETVGDIDVVDVWKGVHLDGRLSPVLNKGKKRIFPGFLSYIFSGCGYGGSCFPKDTKALASFATEIGVQPHIVKSTIKINKKQPERMLFLLKKMIGNLNKKKIAVLGLSFKPNTDDLRESPSFPIIKSLLREGAEVICHDPRAYKNGERKELSKLKVTLTSSVEETLDRSDAALLITSWEEYKKLSPGVFKKYMKRPVLVDGRRIFSRENFLSAGILYVGIGYSPTSLINKTHG